ncbi:ankyrin repeat-containing domain, PGG domain protein [Tanacetum coccineum]
MRLSKEKGMVSLSKVENSMITGGEERDDVEDVGIEARSIYKNLEDAYSIPYGSTLLHVAAIVGNTDAANILVEINHDLLFSKDKEGQTPLSRALSNTHTDTYLYLLNPTNTRDIKLDTLFVGTSGDELQVNAIIANDYHSALVLSKHYRNLNSDSVLMAIAQNFPRKLNIWERMTYACVFEDPTVTLAAVICVLLTTPVLVSGIKFKTALKSFTSAVVVFSFAGVIMSIDPFGNNLLHLAARLAPTSKLSLISGAVLQIQRELQWFKEVEGFVCPLNRIQRNSFGETPKMVFTREHRELVSEGEKWMKATAESYTITAALITTIVFAAAITVPGGNNQDTGIPVFSNDAFTIFAISDAISLFTSTISLLMFLSILTTRFAEEDFLFNLPTKLIFISMTAMIVAFSATLFLVFGQTNSWILIPIAALSCLPITLLRRCSFHSLQT